MGAGWADAHGLSAGCPHCSGWLSAVSGGLCVDDVQGEVLEFGEQGAEFAGVVEQGLVAGELGGGEAAGDGLAVDLAGPFGVGAVQAGRVGVAAAVLLAAGVGADGEGAGQGEACPGKLGGDPVAGRALGCGWFHVTHRLRSRGPALFHSIFLWIVPDRGGGMTPEAEVAGYIARWRPSSVPPQAAGFARDVVRAAGPGDKERAKSLLAAASR